MNSACNRQGSPASGSTLITSAPISASSEDASGPAMIWLQSSTCTPSSAPCIAVHLLFRLRPAATVPRGRERGPQQRAARSCTVKSTLHEERAVQRSEPPGPNQQRLGLVAFSRRAVWPLGALLLVIVLLR